jgi:hypothetical protein
MSTPRENLAAHLYRETVRATGRPQTAWELIDQGVWLRRADEAMAAMGVLPVAGFVVGDCFETCEGHS